MGCEWMLPYLKEVVGVQDVVQCPLEVLGQVGEQGLMEALVNTLLLLLQPRVCCSVRIIHGRIR